MGGGRRGERKGRKEGQRMSATGEDKCGREQGVDVVREEGREERTQGTESTSKCTDKCELYHHSRAKSFFVFFFFHLSLLIYLCIQTGDTVFPPASLHSTSYIHSPLVAVPPPPSFPLSPPTSSLPPPRPPPSSSSG